MLLILLQSYSINLYNVINNNVISIVIIYIVGVCVKSAVGIFIFLPYKAHSGM
jgi:uncharacterized membrane protein